MVRWAVDTCAWGLMNVSTCCRLVILGGKDLIFRDRSGTLREDHCEGRFFLTTPDRRSYIASVEEVCAGVHSALCSTWSVVTQVVAQVVAQSLENGAECGSQVAKTVQI